MTIEQQLDNSESKPLKFIDLKIGMRFVWVHRNTRATTSSVKTGANTYFNGIRELEYIGSENDIFDVVIIE